MKKFFHQLAAAITFFTRIPLWKWVNIPSESFSEIIYLWPLTGWITGGVTAFSCWGFSFLFPPMVSIVLALGVRTLLTGGLHEDGLGDFIDGFGGGKSKEDILRIMKDSHTGSFALIGMIFYYLTTIATLISFPKEIVWVVLITGDPFSKMLTACTINFLPYARTANESKSRVTYKKSSILKLTISVIVGFTPLFVLFSPTWFIGITIPILVVIILGFLSYRKIQGYTGDVCGAMTLIVELSYFIACLLTYQLFQHL